MKKLWFGSVAAALLAASVAQGAGFGLYEGSARGNALGGTLTARADDPSALYYNPAGIVQLPGDQFMVGVSLIRPQTDATIGGVKTSTEQNWWYPPHAYYTHGFSDSLWAGLGLYSRFGLGTEFPATWPGRYNSYEAKIQSLTLNPNVAYKLSDKLSVAAGLDAVWFDMTLKRMALVGGADVPVEMKGDAWGYGFNLAARYAISESVVLGASYVSKVKEEVGGTATAGPASTGAAGGVELPQEGTVALMFKPAEKLSVEVGVTFTGWQSYDTLRVKFDNPAVLGPESASIKDWNNAFRGQVGVEYEATRALVLRAGYVYDEEPIPLQTADYLVPGNDRHLFSAGFGYRWESWVLDLSYTYLMILDRYIPARPAEGVFESDFSGGNAHMLGISVSTKL